MLDILARVGAAELVLFSAEPTPEPAGLAEWVPDLDKDGDQYREGDFKVEL